MTFATPLTLADLTGAVAGGAVAIRARTRLEPAGGPGDKVFPLSPPPPWSESACARRLPPRRQHSRLPHISS
jgi:CRISPR-associated protein Csb1